MTIKDYATSRGVSYETVRRQVAGAKKKALKGHISYQGKQAFLDDYAIEYLDQHRQPRNVVVQASTEEVQRELERLHNQVHQLQEEISRQKSLTQAKSDRIEELLEEKNLLIEDKTKKELLEKELQETKQDLETSREELNKYQRTIFGLYKKVD